MPISDFDISVAPPLPKRRRDHKSHRRIDAVYSAAGEGVFKFELQGVDKVLRTIHRLERNIADDLRAELRDPLTRLLERVRRDTPGRTGTGSLRDASRVVTTFGPKGFVGIEVANDRYVPSDQRATRKRTKVVAPRTLISGRAADSRDGHSWGEIPRDYWNVLTVIADNKAAIVRQMKKSARVLQVRANREIRSGRNVKAQFRR